jgi:hypothetical protein
MLALEEKPATVSLCSTKVLCELFILGQKPVLFVRAADKELGYLLEI